MPNFDLGDYVDVNERLAWFFERYPEGSLQADILERGKDYVVIKALAYRSPEDTRPGSGMASEPVPGRTPYTKDSEVMVGETSAWGRALAAIGAPTKGSIASRQEVANRKSPAAGPLSGVATKGGTPSAIAEKPERRELRPPAGGTSSGGGITPGVSIAQTHSQAASATPGTSSVVGEAAGVEPGEGQSKPSPGFSIAVSECNHKGASGRWLPTKLVDGQARCPRCGKSALIYRETA